MTTALEVIDSAVKIGLGALITATGGYFALSRSHRNEMRKAANEDRRSLLRTAAGLLEQATASANLATYAFAHVPEGTGSSTKQLVEAINKLGEARSLVVLSGAQQLAEDIANLRSAMESLCGYFLSTGDNYSIEEANAMIQKLNGHWPRIYAELERAYGRTHADA
jgi:hypothetical protein